MAAERGKAYPDPTGVAASQSILRSCAKQRAGASSPGSVL